MGTQREDEKGGSVSRRTFFFPLDDGLDIVRTALCLLGGHRAIPCLGIQPSPKFVLNPGSTPGAEVAFFLDW